MNANLTVDEKYFIRTHRLLLQVQAFDSSQKIKYNNDKSKNKKTSNPLSITRHRCPVQYSNPISTCSRAREREREREFKWRGRIPWWTSERLVQIITQIFFSSSSCVSIAVSLESSTNSLLLTCASFFALRSSSVSFSGFPWFLFNLRHFSESAIKKADQLTVMTCFPFLFRQKPSSSTKRPTEFDEELSGVHNVNLYLYKELKIATDDFSPSNKIGEGGFGSVYKGRLKNGKIAAIKVLSAESKQGVKEFLTEIKVISDIEHENLVKLYGCCVQDDQRILVYNYLENNSLAQTLIGGRRSSIQFSWRTRTRICIGVARGLAFLHEEVRPHIIHRDIKASNILLDKDLTPKISDFGLAKLIPANMTHVSTRVAGTIGYLAPEYAIRGQLTRKADIYSFGVLLVEIVSGRCNTNTRLPIEEQFLLERTWQLYEQRELVVLVDAALNGDFDAEEACRFLKIGLLCTQDTPKLRPSMSTVVKMLTGEVDVNERKITKPALISDFMDLKVKSIPETKPDTNNTSSNYPSNSDKLEENSTFLSGGSSCATMTFTAICDRSI